MRTTIYIILLLPFLLAFIPLGKETGGWQIFETKNNVSGRSECGLAAVDSKLYLMGGDGPAQAVEMLDPQTKTWTKKALAPVVMHHFQAVPYNNKIYVLEAFSGGSFPNQSSMANVYSYDTKRDEWNKEVEIPLRRRRAGAGAAVYHGKIYLVCGITNGHSSGTNNMFDVYDPEKNEWDSLPNAPHIRDHGMAAVVKDKLYAIGGRNTSFRDPADKISFFSQTVLDVDCYDFKTGKWSTLDARLPLGSGGGALVSFNNILYYMGGERATGIEPNAPRKNTYYLDPSAGGGWIATADLNLARNGTAAAVLDNKIFLAGGSGGGPLNGQMPANPPNGFAPGDTSRQPPPVRPQGPGNDKLVVEVFRLR